MRKFFLILIVCFLSSCVKNDTNKNNPNISSGEISENFDWNMFKSIKLEIGTTKKYSEDYYYKISVYDKNPIFDKNASLITFGVCKKNQDFMTSVDVPISQKNIFIEEEDPQGKKIVMPFDIASEDKIVYEFASKFSNTTKSGENNSNEELKIPVQESTYDFSIGNAITINSEAELISWNKSDFTQNIIYIPKGVTIHTSSLNIDEASRLKIDGTLIIDKDLTLKGQGYIEVFSNGNIEIQDEKTLNFDNSTGLAIEYGAIVHSQIPDGTGQIKMTQSTKLHNEGHIEIFNLSLTSCEVIRNQGSIIVKNILNSKNSKIRNCTGAYIETLNMTTEQSVLNFEKQSVVYITNDLTNILDNSYINVDHSYDQKDWAYLIVKNFKLPTKYPRTVSLVGDLQISFDELINDIYYDYYRYTNNYPGFSYYGYRLWCQFYIEFTNLEDRFPLPESEFIIDYDTTTPTPPVEPEFPIEKSTNNLFTFISEDTYPQFGDYDMNDIVIDLSKMTTYTNNENKISKCEFTFTLRAFGGIIKNGFAIQLDDEIKKENIKTINVTNANNSDIEVENSMFKNFTNVAIPLFDDCSKVFNAQLVNTQKDKFTKNDVNFVVTIEFNKAIKSELLNTNNINPFIFNFNKSFNQIHTPDSDLLGEDGKMPKGKYMWALKIPGSNDYIFQYPIETISIKNAYPDFDEWIKDKDNVKYQEWYKRPHNERVQSLRE